MIEVLSYLALAVVAALLAIGLAGQFTVLGRRGLLLDRLAIVPQWKFFGQNIIATDPGWSDDHHLLARSSPAVGNPGPWTELDWCDDRPLMQALWNPRARGREELAERIEHLVRVQRCNSGPLPQESLAYLTVLRHCLDRLALPPGHALQFAVAVTRGRRDRSLALGPLSAWHRA